MTSSLFKMKQHIISVALLIFFPFAGFSVHMNDMLTAANESNFSAELASDTIPSGIVLISASYNEIPGEGDDPLHHLEYTIYPFSQVRTLDFSAQITNMDTVEFTGVFLEARIEQYLWNEQPLYSETFYSESITLSSGDTSILVIPDYTPPLEEGFFDIHYTIHWDQDNNDLPTATRSFEIHVEDGEAFIYTGNSTGFYPDVFSRDNGELIASTTDLGTGDTFKAGMIYTFTELTEFCCIGLKYAPESSTGQIKFEIIKLNEPSFEIESAQTSVDLNPFDGSDFHWMQLTYPSGSPLTFIPGPGDTYLVLVEVLNPQEDAIQLGISSNEAADSSAFIFGEFGDIDCTEGCPTNDIFMIRLGLMEAFNPMNLSELPDNVSEFYIAPNPVNGPLSIHYTLSKKSDVEFYIFDNTGRIVLQQNPGTKTSGEHVFYTDTHSLADGVYTASLIVDGKAIGKQLVVGSASR